MEDKSLEQRIKHLERELALKNAYLNATIKFPKGNKIPEDVREEVIKKITELATELAENKEVSIDTPPSGQSQFDQEEISILKSVVNTIKNKVSPVTSGSTPASTPAASASAAPKEESKDMGFCRAKIITLEGVPVALRGKMTPEQEVLVKSIKGDKAFITNPNTGQSGYIPVDNLEMQ